MTTLHPPRRSGGHWLALLVSIAIALAVGAVGGLATASSVTTWYPTLAKPPFNPPNFLFGPVWTALYLLMAVAAWRVWRAGPAAGRRGAALRLYAAQLGLNLGWSLIFFGLRRPDLALIEVLVLFAAILATFRAFAHVDRPAAWMLLPYAAWVAFAMLLNFEIWRLN